ncbi:TetR/AcrR family transcriptional regulator [Labrys monachus]|uniref:AcrR family transcriptional regulator n=1 Tax=Labrys monachus TaxID=217067 RepID=A0ABU0FKV7_9HYPH|nr:TetR/AcrR family transcriptional regulator [Labrys monachus]MDQ0394754.1 AcrR family transcriptional regulator [Labrys monachus]
MDSSIAEPERRRRVLDAAQETFWRFGFRKTSMDEVARAADISRQGLYFYFGSKDDLFREAMRKWLEDKLSAATARLAAPDLPIETRLAGAMDEWVGRNIGAFSGDASDIFEKKNGALLGTMFTDYGAAFQGRLAEAIAASPLAETLGKLGFTPLDLAQTLSSCGGGLKYMAQSREDFARRIAIAVRLLCR